MTVNPNDPKLRSFIEVAPNMRDASTADRGTCWIPSAVRRIIGGNA